MKKSLLVVAILSVLGWAYYSFAEFEQAVKRIEAQKFFSTDVIFNFDYDIEEMINYSINEHANDLATSAPDLKLLSTIMINLDYRSKKEVEGSLKNLEICFLIRQKGNLQFLEGIVYGKKFLDYFFGVTEKAVDLIGETNRIIEKMNQFDQAEYEKVKVVYSKNIRSYDEVRSIKSFSAACLMLSGILKEIAYKTDDEIYKIAAERLRQFEKNQMMVFARYFLKKNLIKKRLYSEAFFRRSVTIFVCLFLFMFFLLQAISKKDIESILDENLAKHEISMDFSARIRFLLGNLLYVLIPIFDAKIQKIVSDYCIEEKSKKERERTKKAIEYYYRLMLISLAMEIKKNLTQDSELGIWEKIFNEAGDCQDPNRLSSILSEIQNRLENSTNRLFEAFDPAVPKMAKAEKQKRIKETTLSKINSILKKANSELADGDEKIEIITEGRFDEGVLKNILEVLSIICVNSAWVKRYVENIDKFIVQEEFLGILKRGKREKINAQFGIATEA